MLTLRARDSVRPTAATSRPIAADSRLTVNAIARNAGTESPTVTLNAK